MNILVINGPNLNMLGIREPALYGTGTYDALCRQIGAYCGEKNIAVEFYQSNHEGDLVDRIQKAYFPLRKILKKKDCNKFVNPLDKPKNQWYNNPNISEQPLQE